MCNMAGYVGRKRAAEVLIDMMLREEGLAGGYFTGIATLEDGKVAHAKLVGDTRRLLDNTNAESLGGNVGIMHSRSKANGTDERAHPFFGRNEKGEVDIAYIANGCMGHFASRAAERNEMTKSLMAEGYEMRSRMEVKSAGSHPDLGDGTSVHVSDTMCQLIYKNIKSGMSSRQAIASAFSTMPGEIAGLLLSPDVQDGVVFARINMPIFVAYAPHGVYIASTALAFPEDAGEPILLPACSSGIIRADGYEVFPFEKLPAVIGYPDAEIRSKAYDIICGMLSERDCIFADLYKGIDHLFDAEVYPREPLSYEILHSLKLRGKLSMQNERVDGIVEGIDAPKTRLRLKSE